MKQFELKFTEQNLERHMIFNPEETVTTRDEPKGYEGDLTVIGGHIYVVTHLYRVSARFLENPLSVVWYDEGFDSHDEYMAEIDRIYGIKNKPRKELYVHHLHRLPMRLRI
ncbi:MAG: hypothetical protein WC096_02110 [Sphaerochaetaceae bacterium]